MLLHRLICLSGLMLMSTVGCCHTQCVTNSCSPCGGGGGGCGGCLTGWLQSKIAACRMRSCCQNYSWGDSCSVCGGESCGLNGSSGVTYGGGGSSCGCSGGQSSGYAPSSPTLPNADPIPVPQPSVPMPPRTNEPTPAPASSESTTFQRPANGQIQHVSVEEFQRLPGVVVSGPTSSVPTMGTPTLAAPTLSNVTIPVRSPSEIQQAQWVPAK